MVQEIPQRLHWSVALGLGLVLTHTFVRVAFDWWHQELWTVSHSLLLVALWALLIACVGLHVRVVRATWLRGAYWTAFLVLLGAPLQDAENAWNISLFRQLAVLVTIFMFLLLAWVPRWAFQRLWDLEQAYRAKPVALTQWRFCRGLSLCLPLSGIVHLARGFVDSDVTPMWETWSARAGAQRSIFVVEMAAQATSVLLLFTWWLRYLILQRRERTAIFHSQSS